MINYDFVVHAECNCYCSLFTFEILIFKFRLLLNTKVNKLTRLFGRSEFDNQLLVIVSVIYLVTTGFEKWIVLIKPRFCGRLYLLVLIFVGSQDWHNIETAFFHLKQ